VRRERSESRIEDRGAALTSTLHWFETELLTREENLVGLMALNRDLLAQTDSLDHPEGVVLDMDSSESHPLFLFNGHGDCLAAKLRSGNVQATHWMRLSCHRFRANEVRLQLSVLAFNLGNLWRRLVLPKRIDTWSLTSLQQRLVKTGGRLVKHARYYWLLLAESHLTRRLFGAMLRLIWALPVPT